MIRQPLRHYTVLHMLLLIIAGVCAGCIRGTVYNHYEQLPVAGWEKNDTITFSIPPVGEQGIYNLSLGLRTTGHYPFMSLTLIAEQQTIAASDTISLDTIADSLATHNSLTPKFIRYTLPCKLMNTRGNTRGQGINYYQYNFHIADVALNEGDSLRISIRHDMKREILPGISDIGIIMTKK